MPDSKVKILFAGDIVGSLGRKALSYGLKSIRAEENIDIVIVNVENAADGYGITKKIYDEFQLLSIDCMTTGNHVWDKKDIIPHMDKCEKLLRPLNFTSGVPGQGYKILEFKGYKIVVVNFLGRVFMQLSDCPFKVFDELYNSMPEGRFFVDFHAEATSEKSCFGHYVDGRALAVCGTHTHVQTNDDTILKNGTFYMSDVGMCGSLHSVIGMNVQGAVERFVTGMNKKINVEKDGDAVFNGVIIEADLSANIILSYKKIRNIFSGEQL